MTTTSYNGRCHCGQTEWTTKLDGEAHILWYLLFPPLSLHFLVLDIKGLAKYHHHLSHCDACKVLSGGENTLNQLANEGDLKITKGSTKTYTYTGDSGRKHPRAPLIIFPPCLLPLHSASTRSQTSSTSAHPLLSVPRFSSNPDFSNQTQKKKHFFFSKIGNPVHCYYCPNCTAHVYHHQTIMGPKIVVRTSLLRDSKGFPVGAEIFGKYKLEWQPQVAEKMFEGPPQ